MSESAPNRNWTVNKQFSRLIKRWDDQAVMYDTGSGDTHLLTDIHADIVTELEQSPLTASQLSDKLHADGVEPFAMDALNELLLDLVKLGVVEPVSE